MRTVFVVGPDKKIKLKLSYPMSTGRNFDEVLRVLDSMQLTAKHKVATPVNWKQGDDVIILPSVSNEEAQQKYPARLEVAQALSAHRPPAEVGGKTRPATDFRGLTRMFQSCDPSKSMRIPWLF